MVVQWISVPNRWFQIGSVGWHPQRGTARGNKSMPMAWGMQSFACGLSGALGPKQPPPKATEVPLAPPTPHALLQVGGPTGRHSGWRALRRRRAAAWPHSQRLSPGQGDGGRGTDYDMPYPNWDSASQQSSHPRPAHPSPPHGNQRPLRHPHAILSPLSCTHQPTLANYHSLVHYTQSATSVASPCCCGSHRWPVKKLTRLWMILTENKVRCGPM